MIVIRKELSFRPQKTVTILLLFHTNVYLVAFSKVVNK